LIARSIKAKDEVPMTAIMKGDDLVEHVDLAEGWGVGGRGDGGVGVWKVWVGVVYLEGTELGFGCRGHHDSGGYEGAG